MRATDLGLMRRSRMRGLNPSLATRPALLVAIGLFLFLFMPAARAEQRVPIAFDEYHGYTSTMKYLKDVAAAYPEITSLLEIGKSNLGRPIYVLVITNQETGTTIDAHVELRNVRGENVQNITPMTPDQGKPGHWIAGAIHGDEFTGTEVCLYIIDKLVSGYGSGKEVTLTAFTIRWKEASPSVRTA
jgi:hypothetical protein